MAKAKKKTSQTLEEKLEQALVPESEQPYEIPVNWVWVRLIGGFSECLDKYRKPVNAEERANRMGNVPYYGATGQVGWIDDFLTDEELVLLGEDGAPFLDFLKDKAYLIKGKAWVNNHAHILRSFVKTGGNCYLVFYLNIFNYQGFVSGTTRLKLTQTDMNRMPIPLPPLKEQQRIVEQIEQLFSKLDRVKELVEEAVAAFEDRKSALLHQAFTGELTAKWRDEHGASLDSWEEKEIGEILTVSSGKLLGKNKMISGNFPVYGGNGIMGNHNAYNVEESTLLIGRVGFYCGSVHKTFSKSWVTDNSLIVTFKDKYNDVDFFQFLLGYMDLGTLNSSTAQPVISGNKIYSTKIIKPTLLEQQEVVRILDSLLTKEEEIRRLVDVTNQVDLLKKTILAKAFRGELGTNDPSEESALELLKNVLRLE